MQIVVFIIFMILVGSGTIGSDAFLKGLGVLVVLMLIAAFRLENDKGDKGGDEDERH